MIIRRYSLMHDSMAPAKEGAWVKFEDAKHALDALVLIESDSAQSFESTRPPGTKLEAWEMRYIARRGMARALNGMPKGMK